MIDLNVEQFPPVADEEFESKVVTLLETAKALKWYKALNEFTSMYTAWHFRNREPSRPWRKDVPAFKRARILKYIHRIGQHKSLEYHDKEAICSMLMAEIYSPKNT
jgi:hypothetical protein